MSSSAQHTANQANAQLSTGPTTVQGKSNSAANSRVHGLCAKDLLIGPEEQPEFDRMALDYFVDLTPKGPVEQTLFDEVVAAAWQLRRVRLMETELCAGAPSYTVLLDDEALQKKLDRLARHHTRIERTYLRCLKELKAHTAQRRHADELYRSGRPVGLSLAPRRRISERTQSSPELDDSERLTPADLAEIDRDLDRMEAQMMEKFRRHEQKAA